MIRRHDKKKIQKKISLKKKVHKKEYEKRYKKKRLEEEQFRKKPLKIVKYEDLLKKIGAKINQSSSFVEKVNSK